MNTPSTKRAKAHRFPAEIIRHGVWLDYRFCRSYRDVEALLVVRGGIVADEALRQGCRKFGPQSAHQLRRRRPRPGDTWHLDEVCRTIRGERHDLWRAVDQDGHGLARLVPCRRDKHAAKTFFRKRLNGCRYVPRVIRTDRLKRDGAAKRALLPGGEHRQHRYLHHRADNSPQPTRPRARHRRRFTSPGHAQRCRSAYGPIAQHFRPRRHRLSASIAREERRQRVQSWQEVTRLAAAA